LHHIYSSSFLSSFRLTHDNHFFINATALIFYRLVLVKLTLRTPFGMLIRRIMLVKHCMVLIEYHRDLAC
jgi:hypothetical protein